MANARYLKQVFEQVEQELNSGKYQWVSTDSQPEDYYDWGLNFKTTAQSIIDSMIADGDLERL